jgi:hypothetical protein
MLAFRCAALTFASEPLFIGTRTEPFIDDYVFASLSGDAVQFQHKPEPQEVVLVTDQPWEGNTCAYYTVFRDGGRYRMYYRGSHFNDETQQPAHREVTCYAESRDGIRWAKPNLGLWEFDGSRQNNIVWDGIGTHCFTPFKDSNPDCPPDARYKAIARGRPLGKKGLYVFKSFNGINWSLMHPEPVITDGDFDSQNLAFWDATRHHYACYYRKSREGKRDIMTCSSDDFVHWSEPEFLEYSGAPREHLYTNAIQPYLRAPHILIGFPTRFRPETEQVEPTLMTSRDGRMFHRWADPLIPVTAPSDRDGNRSNYMTWGMAQLPGDDKHLSVYATEAYYTGPDSRVRRFTFRVDGFVSIRAQSGGEIKTKPMVIGGRTLAINFRTAVHGSVRVEVQNEEGQAVDGFALANCKPLEGDSVGETVVWDHGSKLDNDDGKPVRLRFELVGAEIFSLRFQ